MNPVFAEYGLKDLLPLKLDIPDEGCTRTNSSQFCFEAGQYSQKQIEYFLDNSTNISDGLWLFQKVWRTSFQEMD